MPARDPVTKAGRAICCQPDDSRPRLRHTGAKPAASSQVSSDALPLRCSFAPVQRSDEDVGKLVTTWRTVQKLDADAWRKLRDEAPFRFIRYLGALGVIIGAWDALGTPHSATTWLPVLVIVVLLLLPDASSIAFAGFAWQARQARDEAIKASDAARETASRLELTVNVGTQAGEAAGESAQARSAAAQPAGEALSEFLE